MKEKKEIRNKHPTISHCSESRVSYVVLGIHCSFPHPHIFVPMTHCHPVSRGSQQWGRAGGGWLLSLLQRGKNLKQRSSWLVKKEINNNNNEHTAGTQTMLVIIWVRCSGKFLVPSCMLAFVGVGVCRCWHSSVLVFISVGVHWCWCSLVLAFVGVGVLQCWCWLVAVIGIGIHWCWCWCSSLSWKSALCNPVSREAHSSGLGHRYALVLTGKHLKGRIISQLVSKCMK